MYSCFSLSTRSINGTWPNRSKCVMRICPICPGIVNKNSHINRGGTVVGHSNPVSWPNDTSDVVNLNSKTSCRRAAATICLRPLQVDNIFVFIRQVALIQACWLFKTSETSWPFDLLTVKVMTESRVTWATSVPILVFLASLFSS